MARFPFGGTFEDYAYVKGGGNVMLATPGSTLRWYTAFTAGSQHVDLLLNGGGVTTITADSEGYFPLHYLPDGIASAWGSVDGSTRRYAVSPLSAQGFAQVATPEASGAVGDGSTNDTVAVQAAIDSNLPVWLDPTKTYKVAGLVARNGMQISSMLLPGTGYRASLKTTSGDMWTTPSSGAAFVTGFRFENVIMESTASSGGHLFRGMWTVGSFSNCDFVQGNNAKSIFDITGFIDVVFEGECQMQHTTSSSVSAFKAVTSTGNLAQVEFGNMRCSNSGTHFFYIEGTSGAVPINFGFTNVNFEVCNGGLAKLLSCRHFKFARCGAWDFSAAATNHLFHIDKSATSGAAPRAITFEDCIRDASTAPTGGAQDIFNESTAGTTELNVLNCGHQLASNYLVTAGNATGTVRGSGITTLTTGLNMTTDDFQSVTPTLGGSGTALGNGTIVGRMKRTGKLVDYRIKWTLGSTSTVGTSVTVSLPVNESSAGVGLLRVGGMAYDTGTAFYTVSGQLSTSSTALVYTIGTNGLAANLTSTVPHTWASTDILEFAVIYESA